MKSTRQHVDTHASMSRRRFLGTAATATAAGVLLPSTAALANGGFLDIQGVHVGIITYSYRNVTDDAKKLLSLIVDAGMSTVEMMGGPAELFAGAPPAPRPPKSWREMTDEERTQFRAVRQKHDNVMHDWRKSADMKKYEELGQMYHDAGVSIDILKLGNPSWPDEMIDYAFTAAKAVGARGISLEISNEAAERMGPFATKHQMYVGLHNHTQVADEGFSFDVPLSFSKYNMLNLDIGHYVAGLSESPIPIIKKYHERITHLHLKDRKNEINGQDNVEWGHGDTPIAEVLRLLQKEQYPITAMIELEYEVPEESSVQAEVEKCVSYCRGALA